MKYWKYERGYAAVNVGDRVLLSAPKAKPWEAVVHSKRDDPEGNICFYIPSTQRHQAINKFWTGWRFHPLTPN